jgi:hypothetical protein
MRAQVNVTGVPPDCIHVMSVPPVAPHVQVPELPWQAKKLLEVNARFFCTVVIVAAAPPLSFAVPPMVVAVVGIVIVQLPKPPLNVIEHALAAGVTVTGAEPAPAPIVSVADGFEHVKLTVEPFVEIVQPVNVRRNAVVL